MELDFWLGLTLLLLLVLVGVEPWLVGGLTGVLLLVGAYRGLVSRTKTMNEEEKVKPGWRRPPKAE